MRVTCGLCSKPFDDAERSTICPHRSIMPKEDLKRKMAAIDLLGQQVRFAHQPDGPWRRIQSMSWNGMLTVEGMEGEFAPHLFVPKPLCVE